LLAAYFNLTDSTLSQTVAFKSQIVFASIQMKDISLPFNDKSPFVLIFMYYCEMHLAHYYDPVLDLTESTETYDHTTEFN